MTEQDYTELIVNAGGINHDARRPSEAMNQTTEKVTVPEGVDLEKLAKGSI